MTERVYTINELRKLITESANEFKAKIGDNVENDNKKENSKTYSDIKKSVKEFDGGGNEDKHERNVPKKEDGNRTTLDYSMEGDAGKDFRDKVKAQAEGYTSTLEKNNKIEKIGDFNDKTYQQFKTAGKEMAKNVEDLKKRGLTASKAPDNTFKKDNMYESKKLSVLNFKNTTFINENQMISKIPDDYKKFCDSKGIKYYEHTEFSQEVINNADILYMTRVQRERFTDLMVYEKVKDVYVLKNSMLDDSKENLRILHPLPRVNEIAYDVDANPKAYYFQQAKNGVYARQAIICKVLGIKI